MIRTIIFFTVGGFYTACLSNKLRRYPMLRKPHLHLLYMLIGLGIGYSAHRFEETAPERYERMMQNNKNSRWYRGSALLAQKTEEESENEVEDDVDEEASDEVEDEEDEE